MKAFPLFCACLLAAHLEAAPRFADRFVWVFGWNLEKDSDVADITKLLKTAAEHHFNGAVLSCGLDDLSQKSPDFLRRLGEVKYQCEENSLDLIPAIFSVGYGSAALAHDPNLAEGLPVEDAPFVVKGGEAHIASSAPPPFKNGGFENFNGNSPDDFEFCDQPGQISFADTAVKHSGTSSLRLENFTANQYGHGRAMQKIAVQPHRSYRLTLWVKTEGLEPANAVHVEILTGDREVAPREFHLPATSDWRKVTMLFNSLDHNTLSVYAGVWGAKSGKLWLDDWSIEETGPVNVLRRPGTPVNVRSEDGATVYTEGKDYAPLVDPHLDPWRDDGPALPMRILPSGRIVEGQNLKVSWYHSQIIYDSQVTVCMAEPELYKIFADEAHVLFDKLHPQSVLLSMDEIRMGGTCQACGGHNMGELLGQCFTKEVEILRDESPSVSVYAWADMLDPNCNGHANYYLVNGDFAGAWDHVPRSLIMAVWGGAPNAASLRFFSGRGTRTLVACYYDEDDLKNTAAWLDLAPGTPKLRGFMYTTWEQKYGLLPRFGDLLGQPTRRAGVGQEPSVK